MRANAGKWCGQMGADSDCAHRASACHGSPSQSGSDPFCLSSSGVRASRRPAGPHGSAVRRASRVELPFASPGPACAPELAARPRRALRSTNGRESEPATSSLRYAIGRAKTAPALLKIGPAGHRLARGESGRGQMGSDPDCAHHASARHGGSSPSGSDRFCLSPGHRLTQGAGLGAHRCRSAGETGSEPDCDGPL
jgi:hypothetical protein